MVFHRRIHVTRKRHFKSYHLRYACKTYTQNQVAVKLLGSFRLTAGNRHLHRYCIFTEQVSETVLQALHYSCASELHVHPQSMTIDWGIPRFSARHRLYLHLKLLAQFQRRRVMAIFNFWNFRHLHFRQKARKSSRYGVKISFNFPRYHLVFNVLSLKQNSDEDFTVISQF